MERTENRATLDVVDPLQLEGKSLRDLLIDSIRHGAQPATAAYFQSAHLDSALVIKA